MKRLLLVVAGFCLLSLTGCFHIKQEIDLKADMSGTANIAMGINMEPMAMVMAAFTKSMSGDESPPTEEEIAAARAELLAEQEADEDPFDPEEFKQVAGEAAAEGVRIQDVNFNQDGLKMDFDVGVEFDHIDKLLALQFPDPDGETGESGPGNPMEQPFEGMQIVDEGDTLLLTNEPINPAQDQMESGEVPPEMDDMFREMMKDLRVEFIVTSALPVVEHNATRVDGNTYYWEYDAETLMNDPSAGSEQILLRLQK